MAAKRIKKSTDDDDQRLVSTEINIPIDLLLECVVPRLPIKSLSRFKCVSMSCNSFIGAGEYFLKLYHNCHAKSPRVVIGDDDGNLCVYDITYTYDCLEVSSDCCTVLLPSMDKLVVASSCDGMLCLKEDDYGAKPYVLFDIPSGNMRGVELPTSNMCQRVNYYYELALLLREPTSRKYKLMVGFKITSSRRTDHGGRLQVWITTLEAEQENDRWRCLETNCTYMRNYKGSYANRVAHAFGAAFWVNVDYDTEFPYSKRHKAVVFDIAKEDFKTIALPDPQEIRNWDYQYDVWGGREVVHSRDTDVLDVHLAGGSDENQGLNLFYMYCSSRAGDDHHPMEVWTLKEYDPEKPVEWTNRCVLDFGFLPKEITSKASCTYVIGMFGEQVLFASQEEGVYYLNFYHLRLNTFCFWRCEPAGRGGIAYYEENLMDPWEFRIDNNNGSSSTDLSSWRSYKTFPLQNLVQRKTRNMVKLQYC